MTQSLDFLVGGMPRGGTTALGNLFNVHPDSYCYAAETHWIPTLLEFAGDRPLPPGALPLVESILAQQNMQVLFEMARFSVARGANPRALIFDEADVKRLTKQLIELLESGLFGLPLLGNALALLREHISTRTGKAILGEKTPNNVFAFARYGSLGTKRAFMLVREPYAVIRSMQNRGKDDSDVYAGPFRSDLFGLIGIYSSYLRAIAKASEKPATAVQKYEDLILRPAELVAGIYESVGLRADGNIVKTATNHFKEVTKGNPWDTFNKFEKALIWGLTSDIGKSMGYDSAFYEARGFASFGETGADFPLQEGAYPLYGVNEKTAGEGGTWLMDEGCIALVSDASRKKARLRLWSNFPASIGDAGETATIRIAASHDDTIVASGAAAIGSSCMQEIEIDLTNIPPALEGAGRSLRLIRFFSSHAFRSYLTPKESAAAAVVEGLKRLVLAKKRAVPVLGSDRRLVSFLLAAVEFD